jgi:hypothetical protein
MGTIASTDAFPESVPTYGNNAGLGDTFAGPMFGDVDMEMDLSGAQLWDWFNKNQSIMRMLEDA